MAVPRNVTKVFLQGPGFSSAKETREKYDELLRVSSRDDTSVYEVSKSGRNKVLKRRGDEGVYVPEKVSVTSLGVAWRMSNIRQVGWCCTKVVCNLFFVTAIGIVYQSKRKGDKKFFYATFI